MLLQIHTSTSAQDLKRHCFKQIGYKQDFSKIQCQQKRFHEIQTKQKSVENYTCMLMFLCSIHKAQHCNTATAHNDLGKKT